MKFNSALAGMMSMGLMGSINLFDSFRDESYRPKRKAPKFGDYVPPNFYTTPPKPSKRAKRRLKAKV